MDSGDPQYHSSRGDQRPENRNARHFLIYPLSAFDCSEPQPLTQMGWATEGGAAKQLGEALCIIRTVAFVLCGLKSQFAGGCRVGIARPRVSRRRAADRQVEPGRASCPARYQSPLLQMPRILFLGARRPLRSLAREQIHQSTAWPRGLHCLRSTGTGSTNDSVNSHFRVL